MGGNQLHPKVIKDFVVAVPTENVEVPFGDLGEIFKGTPETEMKNRIVIFKRFC